MIRFASAKWGYAASIVLLPYAILKTLWANGVAILASSAGIRELHASMTTSGDPVSRLLYPYGVDTTALIASLLALALVRNWGRRLPRWLLLLPAGLGGIGFLFVCLVTSYRLLAGDIRMSDSPEFSPWVLLPVYGGFLAWGVTICMAALSYVIRKSERRINY